MVTCGLNFPIIWCAQNAVIFMYMAFFSYLLCLKSIWRYRKWNLGDGIELIVRCEHDAIMLGPNGEESLINVKTLNEWDPRVTYQYYNKNNEYKNLEWVGAKDNLVWTIGVQGWSNITKCILKQQVQSQEQVWSNSGNFT